MENAPFRKSLMAAMKQKEVMPTMPVQTVDADHQQILQNFLAKPIVPIVRGRFAAKMTLVQPKLNSKLDWQDLEPGKRAVYNLMYLDDHDIVKRGIETLNKLKSNVTDRAVSELMILAYNMRDRAGLHCYGEVPGDLVNEEEKKEFDVVPDNVSCSVFSTGELGCILSVTSPNFYARIARAISYIAASYMRLYTQTVENYMKIEHLLSEKFFDFYGYPFPLTNFHPSLLAVKIIKAKLGLNTVLKNTFYNFLYAGEVSKVGVNLKDFLYVSHTSHTGLYAYILFKRIMEKMRVSNRELTDILYSEKIRPELEGLNVVFRNLLANNDPAYQLNMWKYGRIFDSDFLSMLQMKNAKFFIAICANILYIVDREHHSGILNSAHISGMHEMLQRQAQAYAMRAVLIKNSNESWRD